MRGGERGERMRWTKARGEEGEAGGGDIDGIDGCRVEAVAW